MRRFPLQTALTIVVALGLLACDGKGRASGPRTTPAAPVVVQKVRVGEMNLTREYLAVARSAADAPLSVGGEGRVTRVTVREGDHVKRGQLLLQVDPALPRSTLAETTATLKRLAVEKEQAKKDAERFEQAGPTLVSGMEIQQAQTKVAALEAEYASASARQREAKAQLQRHRVIAPFDGVVTSRSVDPGAWVTPGDALLHLVATDRLEIVIDVEPEFLPRISMEQRITLLRGGQSIVGRIVAIVSSLDPLTRTATVRALPEEKPPWLVPGLPMRARFRIAVTGEGVIVPREAVITGVADSRVVVVANAKANTTVVTVVDISPTEMRVMGDDLTASSVVAIQGHERLRAGQDVRVTSP